MFEAGEYVADHVEPTADDQVQPNGVDLRLDRVYVPVSTGLIGRSGKTIGDREAVEPEGGIYRLDPGGYVVRYTERVRIPEGHVGFIYPRSSLMRNGSMLNTAVWDAGYDGRGEGLLEVHHGIKIEPGARIAQLVLARADHTAVYEGSYLGENVVE